MPIPTYRVWHRKSWSPPIDNQFPVVEITGTYGQTLRQLFTRQSTGFILLEHDIAIDARTHAIFAAVARQFPQQILVIPYWIYPVSTGFDHAMLYPSVDLAQCPARAELYGFGCIYLPKWVAPWINPQWDYPIIDTQLAQRLARRHVYAVALNLPIEHTHH